MCPGGLGTTYDACLPLPPLRGHHLYHYHAYGLSLALAVWDTTARHQGASVLPTNIGRRRGGVGRPASVVRVELPVSHRFALSVMCSRLHFPSGKQGSKWCDRGGCRCSGVVRWQATRDPSLGRQWGGRRRHGWAVATSPGGCSKIRDHSFPRPRRKSYDSVCGLSEYFLLPEIKTIYKEMGVQRRCIKPNQV